MMYPKNKETIQPREKKVANPLPYKTESWQGNGVGK